MKNNIFKGVVTTIIGLILFSSGVYYVIIKESVDYLILSILLVSGVSFILFPDDFISNLKKYIIKKTDE
jgi:hypothetical protein